MSVQGRRNRPSLADQNTICKSARVVAGRVLEFEAVTSEQLNDSASLGRYPTSDQFCPEDGEPEADEQG